MTRFIKSAFAALALAIAAGEAAADPVLTPYRVAIAYADLKLDSEAGARAAMTRIAIAARAACGAAPSPRQIKASQIHRACLGDFAAAAVAAIDTPLLTALHARQASTLLASR